MCCLVKFCCFKIENWDNTPYIDVIELAEVRIGEILVEFFFLKVS